ncbi:MAG: hypothetical protein KZQ60_06510 [Candidatus Thiodiazotropha sp. (ex Lucinoma aequizonata)]|nr:hypothetical protein [Candidatus Thiodiazotropha sp. (ex Lucinoma aequizonata)]MCU7888376.1 hypothetical protein [Candidatus Thiodiazotropha sp. (ex Lucinoma aequizonata)]MCU7897469.1 hypothetical protein [Candidatus Thiodiazotropha sp. (ex Lucinoma aequizonata)]MCU7909286.1 hypothetical protein [Candidatus Thiodiazotropha sp. (ex Lucinoma aequizonata)]MCU7914110.1 hypothetical protein [Candidatus Thiodiazotropha sp. (ex Lucinoma aequizonata)]
MPFISPFWSPFRPYNRAYAYRGLTAFAPLSMAVSDSRPIYSGCGHKKPGYDRSPERLFEFIPMWGYKVFFRFALRRVDCPDCGVRIE